jgi:hypothetical protein
LFVSAALFVIAIVCQRTLSNLEGKAFQGAPAKRDRPIGGSGSPAFS